MISFYLVKETYDLFKTLGNCFVTATLKIGIVLGKGVGLQLHNIIPHSKKKKIHIFLSASFCLFVCLLASLLCIVLNIVSYIPETTNKPSPCVVKTHLFYTLGLLTT